MSNPVCDTEGAKLIYTDLYIPLQNFQQQQNSSSNNLYIEIQIYQNASIDYELQIKDIQQQDFEQDFCEQSCQISCNQKNICDCQFLANSFEQFQGQYCQTRIQYLSTNQDITIHTSHPKYYSYFGYQLQNDDFNITVNLLRENQDIQVDLQIIIDFYFKNDSQIPTNSSNVVHMQNNKQLIFEAHKLLDIGYSQIKFGVFNNNFEQNQQIRISVDVTKSPEKLKDESENKALYTVVVLAMIGVVLLGLGVTIYIFIQCRRYKQQVHKFHQEHEEKFEALNEYMPIIKLKDLKDQVYGSSSMGNQSRQNFSQNIQQGCSVCLIEFKSDEELLRKTVCEHVFHKDCLDQWFKKQQVCPNCRQDLQKKAIVDRVHENEQKKQQKKILSQKNIENKNNQQQSDSLQIDELDNLEMHKSQVVNTQGIKDIMSKQKIALQQQQEQEQQEQQDQNQRQQVSLQSTKRENVTQINNNNNINGNNTQNDLQIVNISQEPFYNDPIQNQIALPSMEQQQYEIQYQTDTQTQN